MLDHLLRLQDESSGSGGNQIHSTQRNALEWLAEIVERKVDPSDDDLA